MRALVFTLALAATTVGCASSSGGANDDAGASTMVRNTTLIQGVGGQNAIETGLTSVVSASIVRIGFPADQVFQALSSAYEKLGIPVTTMVSKDRMLGNLDLKARVRLGSIALRRLFDCGGTTGEPNAETFQLTISASSEVKENGDGNSILATVVQATGRSVQFAGNEVRCSTTGELEKQIEQQVKFNLVNPKQ